MNFRFLFNLLIISSGFLALSACNSPVNDASSKNPVTAPASLPTLNRVTSPLPSAPTETTASPPTWQDQWWLDKASRALRGGNPLAITENADTLLAQGKSQVVDQFLADPRFADSVLNFSLMYLGFRQDAVKDLNGVYLSKIFEFSPAILASQEVMKNGDFFRIFDLPQNLDLPPLKRPRPVNPDAGDASLSDSELREKVMAAMQGEVDKLIALASLPTPVKSDICSAFESFFLNYVNRDALNLQQSVPIDLWIVPEYYGNLFYACYSSRTVDFVSEFQKAKVKNEILFNIIRGFANTVYQPKLITDIKPTDYSGFSPSYHSNFFNSSIMVQTLPNSSTNYDRKRSAYVLKRFLCDDLNPVNVENPSAHVGDPHGSNPSCFACHYKLDPMAGFFRNYGQAFNDFSTQESITFDDNAEMKLADYVKAWAGTDSAHPLNVGYIRSTQNTAPNFYGSSLEDLMAFLKTAPEAKRCVVKRAYEYLVSDSQTLDGDYLDYLTNQFIQTEATAGSAVALKSTFKAISLGQAFGTQDANHDTCYDHAPGYVASANSVPCKVSSILNTSCVKCHSSTQASGSLDLSHWQKMADGSFGFPHLAADGSPIAAAKTFQSILDRLSSTDPDVRMPYLTDMPSQDRQQLYLWLNQALTNGTK